MRSGTVIDFMFHKILFHPPSPPVFRPHPAGFFQKRIASGFCVASELTKRYIPCGSSSLSPVVLPCSARQYSALLTFLPPGRAVLALLFNASAITAASPAAFAVFLAVSFWFSACYPPLCQFTLCGFMPVRRPPAFSRTDNHIVAVWSSAAGRKGRHFSPSSFVFPCWSVFNCWVVPHPAQTAICAVMQGKPLQF